MSADPHDAYGVLVRRALVPTALLGAACCLVAIPFGLPAVLGAAVGSGLVVLFFFTTLLLMRLIAPMPPRLTLGVALLTYWTKASLLGLLLMAAPALDWMDPLWFAGTVVAGTIAWMALHVVGLVKARIPVVEPLHRLGGHAS